MAGLMMTAAAGAGFLLIWKIVDTIEARRERRLEQDRSASAQVK